MNGNAAGRIPTLKNAKSMCIVMEEDQREIIADKKGDSSASGFIRDSIMLRDAQSDNLLIQELRDLKEENIRLKRELESSKHRDEVIEKKKEEIMLSMIQKYEIFLKSGGRPKTPENCHNWISGNCKSNGISQVEFLAYTEDLKL